MSNMFAMLAEDNDGAGASSENLAPRGLQSSSKAAGSAPKASQGAKASQGNPTSKGTLGDIYLNGSSFAEVSSMDGVGANVGLSGLCLVVSVSKHLYQTKPKPNQNKPKQKQSWHQQVVGWGGKGKDNTCMVMVSSGEKRNTTHS